MRSGGRRSPGDSAFGAVPGLVLGGLVYAIAEYARQAWWLPSPPGVPGDSGGDPFAHAALGLTFVTLPGLAVWIVLRSLRVRTLFLVWFGAWIAALLPTTLLAFDRAAELLRWDWTLFERGGAAYHLRLLALGLAAVGVPSIVLAIVRPLRRASAGWGLAGLVLTLAAPFALAAALRGPAPRSFTPAQGGAVAAASTPCVLLLTIDTLRPDALAPYGGPIPLPEPMGDARVFEGWSVSSWTLPAMASLFSGLAPSGHGAERGRAPDPRIDWWPERWAEQGWETAAVVGNPFLRRRFAFDRGFAHFEHAEELRWLEPIARTFWAEWWQRRVVDRTAPERGDRRVGRAIEWLQNAPADRPWLLWVHFMDPHLPYHLRGENGALVAGTAPDWIAPIADVLDRGRFTDLQGARAGEVVTTPEQRAALRQLYHTEVDFALHWIGELVGEATRAAGPRRLLWVLTSDHGEEFWENGGFEHGHSLHDTVVRVPLLIGGSASPAIEVPAEERLRLVDVGPVLTRALGLGDFDPRPHSGLVPEPTPLDAFALGAWPTRSGGPALLAEGVLYGPPRTLVVEPGGVGLERSDDSRDLREHRRWAGPFDSSAVGRLESVLLELDLWRVRNADRGIVVESDPDLERRLRAVGYVQ